MKLHALKKDIYTIPQAAAVCGVDRVTMWRWVHSEAIRTSTTAGGHYRIAREDLDRFITSKNMGIKIRGDKATRRILIVDDDPSIQKYLARVLDSQGYEVRACSDGFEAGIELIRSSPHLVLLDLFMPKIDGFKVCELIKNDPDTAHVKVIAISGQATEQNIGRIIDKGADRFLSKPLSQATLLSEVQNLLGSV